MRRSVSQDDFWQGNPSFRDSLLEHMGTRNTDIVHKLVLHCSNPAPGIALNCGLMLRDAIRDEQIVVNMFAEAEKYVWPFFEAEPGTRQGGLLDALKFDLASDAFATLRDLLTRHKAAAKVFLEERYVNLFGEVESGEPVGTTGVDRSSAAETQATREGESAPTTTTRLYDSLLQSQNYVTRRQSLKLLGELLLDRNNFSVMMKYISSKRNLKQMMVLLRDDSKSIQFEAFHVFKVFVANPRKPETIIKTLFKNKRLLVEYLEYFHEEKREPQFLEEKSLIINTIQALQDPDGAM